MDVTNGKASSHDILARIISDPDLYEKRLLELQMWHALINEASDRLAEQIKQFNAEKEKS